MTYYPSASGPDPHYQLPHQEFQSPAASFQRHPHGADTIKVSLATLAGGTHTSSTRSSTPSSFSPQSPTSYTYTSSTDDSSMTDIKADIVNVSIRDNKPVVKLPPRTTRATNNGNSTSSIATITQATAVTQQQMLSSGKGGPHISFSDTLYIDGLAHTLTNEELVSLMRDCDPIEVQIFRDSNMYNTPTTGYIRFPSPDHADRAYALYNNVFLTQHSCLLRLGMNNPNEAPEPESTAHILQVKQLAPGTDNFKLYNLFRPYGPIFWCRTVLDNGVFKGVALVQYFKQEDADEAQEDLHCKEVDRKTIAVARYIPQKGRAYTPQSMGPVPNGQLYGTPLNVSATPFQYNPQGNSNAGPPSPSPAEPTPTMDPCNLYIKNLDLNIKSSDLFNNFRKFGRIISARVMNNPITGQSKGFGFVSFSKPEEASKALAEMNGKLVMSKQIVVAYHEPKKPRDKPSSNTPSSSDISVGERRPSADVRSMPPQSSPTSLYPPGPEFTPRHDMRRFSSPAPSPYAPTQVPHQIPTPNHPDGSFNPDFLAHLGGVSDGIRNDLIRNEVHKKVVNSGVTNSNDVEQIVNTLLQLSLTETMTMLKYPQVMHDKIKEVKDAIHKHSIPQPVLQLSNMYNQDRKTSIGYTTTPPISISPAPPMQIPQRVNAAPPPASSLPNGSLSQHNVSFAQQLGGSFSPSSRTLRRRGSVDSVSSVMTEVSSLTQRKKMFDAVQKLGETEYVDDIVDMLLTLKRKERSLCIFNNDFLRAQVKSAKDALDIFQDDDVDFSAFAGTTTSTPTTPIPQNIMPVSKPSSKSAKTTLPARSVTPPAPVVHTPKLQAPTTPILLSKVSKAIPIVAPPASQSPTTPEPQNPSPMQAKMNENYLEMERFLASIEDKSLSEKKQKLGDRLFPKVKDTGVKHAPKVTIRLLDTIELRTLAHLMYEPNKLKEKVDQASASLN